MGFDRSCLCRRHEGFGEIAMSMFGFYYVGSMLREMRWPRKQGFLKGEAYDSKIVEATIGQMVDWAAALGAGRPSLALQMIAEMFRDRDWNAEGAPSIEMFISRSRETWDQNPSAAPKEIAPEPSLVKAFGATMSPKNFQDPQLRTALEQQVLETLLWGLANPDRFKVWYDNETRRTTASLPRAKAAGLGVEALPPLAEWLSHAESVIRDYESQIGKLPAIPPKLLNDAKSLGIALGE